MTDPTITVAQDLTAICELATALEDQALHRAAANPPGGDALVSLAPVASPEAWQWRIDAAEERGEYVDLSHEDPDWEPPLQTLLFWSEQWRVERGEVTDLEPTIKREADYLRQIIDWACETEPHFDDFAAGIRAARSRLEGSLRAGSKPDTTRVNCIDVDCERKPRLIRAYGAQVKDDRYRCPACRRSYDDADYARALGEQMASAGAERWVTRSDAMALLASERTERTVERWLAAGRVRMMCDRVSHRVLVWWPDVRALHLEPPTRGPRRAA